jgi:hypothetical protein
MSAEANRALVRRFYEEIDKGNLDAMDTDELGLLQQLGVIPVPDGD